MRQLLNLLLFTAILAVSFLSLDGQIPKPAVARQRKLNKWLSITRGMDRAPFMMTGFLHRWGVRALATGFYGVAINSQLQEIIFPLTKDEEKTWKIVSDKVSNHFLYLAGIAELDNLPFYIVTSGDGLSHFKLRTFEELDFYLAKLNLTRAMIKGDNFRDVKEDCLTGRPFVSELLRRSGHVRVAKVFAYDPLRFQNNGTYRGVNPNAKLDDKMPMDKTFHLEQVKKHSGLLPSEILFIDDNFEFCKAASRQGYLALHVNVPKDAPEDKPALQLSRLEAV